MMNRGRDIWDIVDSANKKRIRRIQAALWAWFIIIGLLSIGITVAVIHFIIKAW